MPVIGLLSALGTINSAVSSVTTLYKPASRALEYWANRTTPNNMNDPGIIIGAYMQGLITPEIFYASMEYYGYDKRQSDFQISVSLRRLDMPEYVQLWRRGLLDDVQLKSYAQITAYHPDEVENLKRITEFYPNVSDLIRFAVRDVYTPHIVREYGLLEDYPEDLTNAAFKSGVSLEQCKNFWAAHWELPSLQMGYAMFHRKIISAYELQTLMKSQDIMPYWRERLTRLSYNVLTRVDARRMYGFGVITEDKLTETFEAQGYSPIDAKALTEFTIKYEDDEYTGITRANLVTAFVKGLLTEKELENYLIGLGMGERVVDFWVSMAVYDRTVKLLDQRSAELKREFLDGVKTLEQVQVDLVAEGVSPVYITELLEQFRKAKLNNYTNVPYNTLLRWLRKGIISEERFVIGMRRLGYDEEIISNYMVEIMEPDTPITRKYLKLEKYVEWYTSDLISDIMLRKTLFEMNYSRDDVDIIISQANEKKQKSKEQTE